MPAPASAERPNIVLIFVDDMGYGDLASYGHPTIRTPNLDRMATEGVRLTSFYVAAPACSASRAALLTGRYPVRSGFSGSTWVLSPVDTFGLPQAEVTLAEALKARGYRTAAIGKWHLGHLPPHLPTRHGFDSYLGIPYSNDMDKKEMRGDPPVPLLRGTEIVEQPVDQSTMTQRFTDEAIRVIREAGDQPFFVYLAHPMPHLPIHASEAFRGRSRGGAYGDVIEEMDAATGRILATLRELGIDRNTVVVFASDNGPWENYPAERYLRLYGTEPSHVGSPGPLRGSKGTTYEGGMRVPAIVRWPAEVPPEQESAEVVTSMDLYTTLLRIAGAEVPEDRPVDGRNVMSVLQGQISSSPEAFYYFGRDELEAVREGRWKLRQALRSREGETRETELFDLEVDPGERFNLAATHPRVVERLQERMRVFAQEIGASGRP